MKNKKALLVSALLAACTLTTTAGISAMAETVSVDTTKPASVNVVRGLTSSAFSVTDYEGNALGVMSGEFVSADFDYTLHNLNDGYRTSWSSIAPTADGSTRTLGWFSVDLGAVMVMDKIIIDMQHDWQCKDFILQVASKADFSDATTIFNNDIDGSMGLGSKLTADPSVAVSEYLSNSGAADSGNTSSGGNIFNFSPVAGRYVRVTNNQYGNAALKNYTAIGEIEVYAYEIPSVNVARSLATNAFSVTDYQGNPIEHVLPGRNVDANSFDYTFKNLNDGYKTSWSAIVPSVDGSNNSLGWFNVDLGQAHTVTKLMVSMQHDWEGQDVVIQLANKADYSDAVTVYSNDIDNSLNLGAATVGNLARNALLKNFGSAGQSTSDNGNYFLIAPTTARYVRVTNNQYGDAQLQNYTAVGEIEVYASTADIQVEKPNQVSPVGFSEVSGTYGKELSVALASAQADAEIYYTLDGSAPTKNSEKYTAPIKVAMNSKVMIRAAAVVDGVLGLPTTASYIVQDENIGKNVAINKPVTVKSLDMTQDWTNQLTSVNKAGEEGANGAWRIADGSFNIYYAISTGNLGRGWAIIDLEAEYYIDYIIYEAYWDWSMGNNVIQMANNADFSDAVTVWEYSGGIQTGVASSQNGYKVDINHKGRYIRVTNEKEDKGTLLSSWTEIQAYVGDERLANVGSNIAKGKNVKMYNADFTEEISVVGFNGAAADKQLITDGSFNPTASCVSPSLTGETAALGWAVVDFGAEYFIDKVGASYWHNWPIVDTVIQLSTTADFANPITVYEGRQENVADKSTVYTLNAPVKARYLRAYNNANAAGYSVFTELEAYVAAPVELEIVEQNYVTAYDYDATPITVANGTAWTDINLPTEITATMSDGTTATVAGTFAIPEGYNGNAGVYTAKFVATDASALNDAYELLAKVEVVITVEKLTPTISVEVAERIVADGNAPVVTVNASMDYVVEYYQGETKLDAAPTAAGEYKVVAIIAESANNNAATAEKSFVIVDYRALAAKLAEVAALEQATYTSASWTAFAEVKAAAETVAANEAAAQADIDGALSNLTSAVEALVVKADFSALQAAVAAAEEVVLDSYISAGKADFSAALAAAKAALENDATAQADVDAAKAALEAAQAALVQKGDKAELNSLLAEVAELVEGEYTAETWTAFAEAKAAAEAVVANEDAVQADIDAAKAALETAKGALAQKPADEPVDEPSDEQPSEEKPSDEQPSEEKPSDEKPAGGLGCGATISIASIVMIAGLGVANLLRKKEED